MVPESPFISEEPEGWAISLGGFLKLTNEGGFVEPENLGTPFELAGWLDSLAPSLGPSLLGTK